MKIKPKDFDRIDRISKLISLAESPLRILSAVTWPIETQNLFFEKKARELPNPTYPAIDLQPSRDALKEARLIITNHPIDRWLLGICEKLTASQNLIENRGQSKFLDYSRELYGDPNTVLLDGKSTSLGLAQELNMIFQKTVHNVFSRPAEACLLAPVAMEMMQKGSEKLLGQDAPRIEFSESISAKAVAGSNIVKLKKDACFSERDIAQLLYHEVGIHVATSLNGSKQMLPILAASHAGTTKTQEGLAVFAEMISGSIDVARMHRLADRVLAIKMAIDGGDFIDVYQYFLERTNGIEQEAYELARRVFRGGVVSGGAPFTKDGVYLDGLLKVHNFFRSAIANGRLDCLMLLFCGKMDIDDLPILSQLCSKNLIKPPQYVPKWISDPGFLVAYMAYSNFLNKIKLGRVRRHYQAILNAMPICFVEE